VASGTFVEVSSVYPSEHCNTMVTRATHARTIPDTMIPLTRTIDLLLKGVAVTFLGVVAALMSATLARAQRDLRGWLRPGAATRDHDRRLGKRDALTTAVGVLTLIVAVVAYRLPDQQLRTLTRVGGGTILVSSVAGALFFVKVNYLRIYSLLEISFALTLAARTIWRLGDEIDALEGLEIMTAAYLVIRGLDNFKKDLDARRAVADSSTIVAGRTVQP
jgi:hypothetical protein